MPPKKSLILITVDCLRADHCGFYGYSRPTTPFLDSVASDSIVVPTAVVAGAPTYYSLPVIFASRMPLALGRDVVGLAPDEETLATALHKAGYATAAFTAANPYISPRFGYDEGFDVFRDFLDFDVPTMPPDNGQSPNHVRLSATLNRWLKRSACATGLGRLYDELYFQYCVRLAAPAAPSIDALRKFPSADILAQSVESWLASLDSRPFFLWIHLMDPHAPYYPPTASFKELTGSELSPTRARYLNAFWNRSDLPPERLQPLKESIIDLYDAAIRWTDSQIARLAGFLQRSNLWDNCVFVLTADHGEELLDHGRRYHSPASLSEEIARVPLLIRVPGQTLLSGERNAHSSALSQKTRHTRSRVFSLLHLAPTLLEILDVPAPRSFQGESLWQRLLHGAASSGPVNGDPPEGEPKESETADLAIAESIYGCTNPFNVETLLSARLLTVRGARYKLVIRLDPGAVEEIYDLASDPHETNPLPVQQSREIRNRLLQIAAQHISQTAATRPVATRLKTRLRDLRLELDA